MAVKTALKEDVAMRQSYLEAIESASRILAEAFMQDLQALLKDGLLLDRKVHEVVCEVGQAVLRQVYEAVASYLVGQVKEASWEVERCPTVGFKTLFRVVEVSSPYLWKPGEDRGFRPMKEVMGVRGGGMSVAVERALVDFGESKVF